MRNVTLEAAKTCIAPHLHNKSLGKCPEKEASMLVHIGADMVQMKTPIWTLRHCLQMSISVEGW
jgi:hypothetical protein